MALSCQNGRGSAGLDRLRGRWTPSTPRRSLQGRPATTSHAEIEAAAFRLFAERGFEGTTMDAIAAEVGVGRRTLFRYFESKNDIPWGQFGKTLDSFRVLLAAMPPTCRCARRVHRGVVAFNIHNEDGVPSHRERMRLILETPALQAHSVLRYAEWRGVVADFVADPTRAGAHRRAARGGQPGQPGAGPLGVHPVAALARADAARAARRGVGGAAGFLVDSRRLRLPARMEPWGMLGACLLLACCPPMRPST